MRYRQLGSIDFQASEISFGGASISGEGRGYGFGAISEVDSIKLLHLAVEMGVNCFDSAPIYGFRTSEQRMGKAFRDIRDKVFLVTKCGVSWHDSGRVDMNNSVVTTKMMFERSLKDLQTDYIDLYMVHWPDSRVDIRETIEVIQKEKEAGRIRYIGLCNTNSEELKAAQEVATIDVLQSELSLTNQEQVNNLLPICQEQGLGFMSWGTLDKGILTGRVGRNRTYEIDDCRKKAPWWKKDDVLKKLDKVDKLNEYLKDKDYGLLECALGFNLSQNKVSTLLCGARNPEQLASLIKAYENLPSQNEIDEIKEFFL